MNTTRSTNADTGRGTIASYTAGFLGSLACTLAAYALVTEHLATPSVTALGIVAFALIQLCAQLVLFLHLGRSGNVASRAAFAIALIIIFIVVAGSLWIMHNLSSRMMPSTSQMLQYMQNQDSM